MKAITEQAIRKLKNNDRMRDDILRLIQNNEIETIEVPEEEE